MIFLKPLNGEAIAAFPDLKTANKFWKQLARGQPACVMVLYEAENFSGHPKRSIYLNYSPPSA